MRIVIIDKDGLTDILAKAGAEGLQACKQAVSEEAQLIFRDSQKIVPVETGTLRRSGVVEPAKEEGTSVSVTIGYGGAASDYALRQHEDLSYKHAQGKQAKYLEEPFRKKAKDVAANIYKRIERILG